MKPTQVISNEILNGEKSQDGVGLPKNPDNLNISQEILINATSSSKTSEASPRRPSRSGKETTIKRHKSPTKARSPMRMQFPDSDSEDEGMGFSALKSFYPALNAVEQCSLLQYYSRGMSG
jgi:hypothetical protein